jgi:hypothetical protein
MGNTHPEQDMTPDELERFEEQTVQGHDELDDRLPASDAEIAQEHVPDQRSLDVPPIAPD